MACHLGIQTYREPSWDRREQRYAPANPDLFSQPEKSQASTDSLSANSYQNDSLSPVVAEANLFQPIAFQ
jgi:hypothetical protein